MPFQQWCIANGYRPANTNQIKEAVERYLESSPEAMAMCRPPSSANARALAIYQSHAGPNPMPPVQVAGPGGAMVPNPALVLWKTQLVQRIDQQFTQLTQQGTLQITQEVTAANNANRLADATVAIPSGITYLDAILRNNYPLAKGHVVGYIDYLIAAINSYITDAVNHSNRRKRIRDGVLNTLNSAKANINYLPPDGSFDAGIFNKNIPGATGDARSLADIAEYWSDQRTKTASRMQNFSNACGPVAGQIGNAFALRRYGSGGEADDIRQRRGFYQAEGISFEQYKWFLDLGIQNATTSVADTDRAFFVRLKNGALDAIRGLEQEYDRETEPPVIHKPDMGGEIGCFGVHEDCLVAFNTRMVGSIQIKNQKTNSVMPPDVIAG